MRHLRDMDLRVRHFRSIFLGARHFCDMAKIPRHGGHVAGFSPCRKNVARHFCSIPRHRTLRNAAKVSREIFRDMDLNVRRFCSICATWRTHPAHARILTRVRNPYPGKDGSYPGKEFLTRVTILTRVRMLTQVGILTRVRIVLARVRIGKAPVIK